jgi:hypothetical protein
MKTKELIKQLQELDPTGEVEVCINNTSDIFTIDLLPAYYDGKLTVLKRDLTKECYNITGIEIKAEGQKISLLDYPLEDYIIDQHKNLNKLNITFDHEPSQHLLKVIEIYKQKALKIEKCLNNGVEEIGESGQLPPAKASSLSK